MNKDIVDNYLLWKVSGRYSCKLEGTVVYSQARKLLSKIYTISHLLYNFGLPVSSAHGYVVKLIVQQHYNELLVKVSIFFLKLSSMQYKHSSHCHYIKTIQVHHWKYNSHICSEVKCLLNCTHQCGEYILNTTCPN